MASNGSSSIGTASRSISLHALSATARWPRRCSPQARPTTAISRKPKSRLCAQRYRRNASWRRRRSDRRRAHKRSKVLGATAIRRTRPPGVKPVIRLKAPLDGETVIEDRVQGRVVWQNADLDDMIILRSDGTPVYNHAVVVDDHDMGITHVIRGVDHLTNAARQVQIYKAMGWEIPVFAHVPLIHGPDGAKLSKRHGSPGDRGVPRHGLPAGRLAELPGAARLEPRRRRDLLHRADDRVVRHRRHQQGARPARFCQARRRQRPLHPPGQRPTSFWPASRTFWPTPRAAPRCSPGSTRWAGTSWRPPCLRSRSAPRPSRSWSTARATCWPAGRSPSTTRPPSCSTQMRARTWPGCWRGLRASRTGRSRRSRRWFATSPRRSGLKLGKIAQPLRAALTGSRRVASRVRRHGGAGTGRGAGAHPRSGAMRPDQSTRPSRARLAFALGISCRSAKCIIVR